MERCKTEEASTTKGHNVEQTTSHRVIIPLPNSQECHGRGGRTGLTPLHQTDTQAFIFHVGKTLDASFNGMMEK